MLALYLEDSNDLAHRFVEEREHLPNEEGGSLRLLATCLMREVS